MKSIPEATVIVLTPEERCELEGLARSRKTEHRLRQRARIVLHAANGMATRAIGRAVGCTTGTASKWRVRYAERRLAGLDETGNRGAEPKYTQAADKRILALLDQPVLRVGFTCCIGSSRDDVDRTQALETSVFAGDLTAPIILLLDARPDGWPHG
jgi:hypothetical protein